MKALAGGLITNSRAAFAYMSEQEGVLPIWGIQREHELAEWLRISMRRPCSTMSCAP